MTARYDEVPARSLDEVFARNAIEACDLLKIDVEGSEYAILHGASDATLARVARIHGEYHDVAPEDPRTRIDAFADFLRSRGYAVEVVPHPRKPNLGLFFAARPRAGAVSESRALRILWVASKLAWHGGIGNVVARGARALAARGHEVHVAGPTPDGDPGPLAGVAVHAWRKRRMKVMQLVDLAAARAPHRAGRRALPRGDAARRRDRGPALAAAVARPARTHR